MDSCCLFWLYSYLLDISKELFVFIKQRSTKIQLYSKNNWLYDPKPSPDRYKILKSHFSKIFNKGDNNSQNISDEFWGLTTLKQRIFFNADCFIIQ